MALQQMIHDSMVVGPLDCNVMNNGATNLAESFFLPGKQSDGKAISSQSKEACCLATGHALCPRVCGECGPVNYLHVCTKIKWGQDRHQGPYA